MRLGKANQLALRVAAYYVIAAFLWNYVSDQVLQAFISHANAIIYIDILKDSGFALITGGLIFWLLRRSLRRWELEAGKIAQAEAVLAQSNSLLNATLESTADGILVVDSHGKVASFNQKFLQLWHIPAALAASKDDQRLLQHVVTQLTDPAQFQAKVQELYHNPQAESWDELKFRDGRIFERYSKPQRLAEKIVGRVWSFRDITKRKQAEAKLLESEDRFRSMIEGSSLGIFVNLDMKFAYVNPAALRLLGAEQSDQLLGQPCLTRIHPDYHERIRERAAKILNRQESAAPALEEVYLRLDGTSVPVEVTAAPIFYQGQHGAVVFLQDITERKRTEEALRTSEARYVMVERAVADGMWDWNILTDEDIFSPRWKEILGYRDDELANHKSTFLQLVHPDDRTRVDEVTRGHLEQGKPYALEVRLRHKDGSYRWLFTRGVAMRDATGRPVRMFGATTDITERKQAETALRTMALRHQKLLQTGSDGIHVLDLQGNVVEANAAFAAMLGYTLAEALRLNMVDWDAQWSQAELMGKIANLMAHPEVFETRHRRKDGTFIDVEISASAVVLEGSQFLYNSARDITARKAAEAALQLSEFSVNHASLATLWITRDARIVRANAAAAAQLGYTEAELLQLAVPDLDPDYSATSWTEHWQELRAQKRMCFETQHRHKDGHIFPVEVDLNWFEFDGQEYNFAFTRNITERKRTEAALRHSESVLMEGQRLAKLGNWEWNTETDQHSWSPEIFNIYGRDPALGPATFLEVPKYFTPESWTRLNVAVEQALKNDTHYECDAEVVRPDGTVRWITARGEVVRDAGGKRVGLRGTVQDITERKLGEEAHARLAMLVEQATESIVIADAKGKITYVNPAFEKTSGYSLAEVLGQNPRLLKSGQHDAEFYRRLWAVLLAGEVWSGHFVNRRKDGTLYEEDATISPIRDAAGKVISFMAVKRDTTREAQLETQLRQSQKMEAIGQLAGGVAHDFNNILASTLMQVELLTGEPTAAEIRDGLEQIRADANRAANLTRQLLLFSRRQVMQPRVLDLNELITNLVKMLQRIIGEHVQMQLNLHPVELLTRADAGMLDQVLMNLVVNARDAMPGGGQLRIETTAKTVDAETAQLHAEAAPGRYVCFSVTDSGGGIPPEILPRIFEPFFTTKVEGKGTGLGLATVYGIVKQHHGWIQLVNRPGQGVTFQIFLPASTTPSEAGTGDTQFRSRRGTATILLVEDEAGLLKLARKILERQGYRVWTATNGQEALELWQTHHATVALLLTDMVMPGGLSGRELAQRMQTEKPGLKVVFMSGYSATIAGQEFQLKAGETFIQKPFAVDQLLKTVHASLEDRGS